MQRYILIMEDTRTPRGDSMSESLRVVLKERGHRVELFDGRNDQGDKLTDPVRASAEINKLSGEDRFTDFIMDLNWWGDADYALEVLRSLNLIGRLPPSERIFAYSRYIGSRDPDYAEIFNREFGVPRRNLISRLSVKLSELAQLF
jgi:hypothetical protein